MRSAGPKKHGSKLESRKAKWGYVFLLPWFAFFLVFSLFPFLFGIVVSFTDYNLGSMNWIGLQNFLAIFHDYTFWRSLFSSLCYAVIVIPLQLFIPMWAANTLRPHGSIMNTVVKLLFYLPGVVCAVALIIVWKFVLAPNTGLFSEILIAFGITRFSIFDSANTAIPVIALMVVMSGLGQNLIIYSAAINAIPETYYEAADIDGATRGQQFRQITMPLLHQTIIYVLVTATIGALQIFVIPQLMTGGGPNYTTSTLLMQIYNSAFTGGQFGYASALGVILFIITAVIALVQFKIMKHDSVEF